MKRFLPILLTIALLISFCLTGCDTLFQSTEETESSLEASAPSESESNDESEQASTPSTNGDTNESEHQSTADESNESEESQKPADPKVEHTDIDDNGLCDDCGLSVIIILDIFGINDLHGKICDSSAQPGVDEMTTYLKNAYITEDHVLILSSGDMWQGSSESNLTKGLIVTEWMNELDFVSDSH